MFVEHFSEIVYEISIFTATNWLKPLGSDSVQSTWHEASPLKLDT